MKQRIAWILAWTLFLIGHLISIPMVNINWFGRLYPIYNKLMCLSSDIQNWGKATGPWTDVKSAES